MSLHDGESATNNVIEYSQSANQQQGWKNIKRAPGSPPYETLDTSTCSERRCPDNKLHLT
jgi:hypothetical protein